jgi:hypothetical protein
MRVVRAILGRFARFLVRVARTLDPELIAAPYWVMPERMAALRQRYPGAPEHWLELVARRTTPDDVDPGQPNPHAARHAEEHYARPEAPSHPQRSFKSLFRKRDRLSLRFPQPGSRKTGAVDQVATVVNARRTVRPGLSFGAKLVRNPIANLLRIDRPARRAPPLQFSGSVRDNEPEQPQVKQSSTGRGDHPTFFPDLTQRDVRPPEVIGAGDEFPHHPATDLDLRWPTLTQRAADVPRWRDEPRSGARPDPSFKRNDPRWPELPPIAVEFGFPQIGLNDEALLLAEQIGGTWSE